jgi:hypothetical protein
MLRLALGKSRPSMPITKNLDLNIRNPGGYKVAERRSATIPGVYRRLEIGYSNSYRA